MSNEPYYDNAALEIARRFTADSDVRNRASLQCAIIAAMKSAEPYVQHTDDKAVNSFAEAMKHKLAEARAKGRGGWESEEVTAQDLSAMLRRHVEKGDPRDVANFCMMLYQRGESIVSMSDMERASTYVLCYAGVPACWRVRPEDMPEAMITTDHVLYEKEDADCPERLKDRNGDIVLGMCRVCGAGEADLVHPCLTEEERALLRREDVL